jgi:hypothetical protein
VANHFSRLLRDAWVTLEKIVIRGMKVLLIFFPPNRRITQYLRTDVYVTPWTQNISVQEGMK